MMSMKVPQGIGHTIVISMHRANTPNAHPLVTMGWTPIIQDVCKSPIIQDVLKYE
jgi:hypothetical protein